MLTGSLKSSTVVTRRPMGGGMATASVGGPSMTWTPGPLVARRRLGAELRKLRDDKQMKLEVVAAELDCSLSKISRLETGKGIPRYRDVRDMLRVYDVGEDTEEGRRLLDWARDGRAATWWSAYSDVLPPKFDEYVELEWDASRIDAYEPHIVHGLLQTPDYAAGVLAAMLPGRAQHQVDRLVEVRMRRQLALRRDEGRLSLRCFLDESALYRVVTSEQVLYAQLEHLVRCMDEPTVEVMVLPFRAGVFTNNLNAFAVVEVGGVGRLVHLETSEGTMLLDDAGSLERHERVLAQIEAAALSRGETLALLKAQIGDLRRVEDDPA
jgi:transcriptional regulator with XRE-family HTH domain